MTGVAPPRATISHVSEIESKRRAIRAPGGPGRRAPAGGSRAIRGGGAMTAAASAGLDRATLWMEPADARLYRDIVEPIRREVREDETILAIPFNPEFYFLSRRRNPARYSNSAFGARDAQEAAYAVAALSRAAVGGQARTAAVSPPAAGRWRRRTGAGNGAAV